MKNQFCILLRYACIVVVLTTINLRLLAQSLRYCYTHLGANTVTHNSPSPLRANGSGDILYVQTVVHCIYNNASDSIAASDIKALIDKVNKIYRKDVDFNLINPVFHARVADARIQFCLASAAPDGSPTTGIVYKHSNAAFSGTDSATDPIKISALGGDDPWNTNQYLNIWITQVGDANSSANYGIPWYMWAPGTNITPNHIMGVVLDVDAFTQTGIFGDPVGTLAHEVGHVFGLRHTHGDAPDPSLFCSYDDGFSDTPLCSGTAFSACGDFSANTCIEPTNDEVDNIENIMAYTCSMMMTTQQADFIYANLLQTGAPAIFSYLPCSTTSSLNSPSSYGTEVLLSPNPNQGQFTLHWQRNVPKKVILQLCNSMGEILQMEELSTQEDYNYQKQLPVGIYWLNIIAQDKMITKRIIIH